MKKLHFFGIVFLIIICSASIYSQLNYNSVITPPVFFNPPPNGIKSAVVTTNDFDNFYLGLDVGEPYITTNPRDPLNSFCAFNVNGLSYTLDGYTWIRNSPSFPGYVVDGDPVMTYDSIGNAFYTQLYLNGVISGIVVVKSTNKGITWQNSGYIEGFLKREHTGPEHLEELVNTLRKMSSEEPYNVHVLRESIEALSRAAEMRESNNSGHGESVGRYVEILGRGLGLSPEELADLVYAARVHDVGKIFVPERILNKPSPLTDDEYYLAKVHAKVGSEIVATIPGGEVMAKAVEHHHEAFDGSGYPAGMRGDEIPLWARIICVADAYVNMTTDRSFAAAKRSDQAIVEMEGLAGVRYDGMMVRLLSRFLKTEKVSSSRSE